MKKKCVFDQMRETIGPSMEISNLKWEYWAEWTLINDDSEIGQKYFHQCRKRADICKSCGLLSASDGTF